jgi:nucleoside-diphosphate-sugar epimerase
VEDEMSEQAPGALSPEPHKRVALSGASGFVGGVLRDELVKRGCEVVAVDRGSLQRMLAGEDSRVPLVGCSAAIHLAGRAHVLRDSESDRAAAYRVANRDTTLAFADACARAGVRRFVFVSSIHVNGSASVRPFRPDDPPCPREPYAVSKLEAEQGLWELAQRSGLEVVVVRPALVYGPEAKANFLRLLKLAALPLPLPLAGVSGRRSLMGVWNLADLLIRCTDHPSAPGRTLLAADAEAVALPELIRTLSEGMGKRARLVHVPEALLRLGAGALGMGHTFEKLAGTLLVDATETCRLLDWRPPMTAHEGLTRTARWYVAS